MAWTRQISSENVGNIEYFVVLSVKQWINLCKYRQIYSDYLYCMLKNEQWYTDPDSGSEPWHPEGSEFNCYVTKFMLWFSFEP